MKNLINLLTLLSLIIFSVGCNSADNTKEKSFISNGQAIDSLKIAYQAESIKFDKWEATGVTDSTFSICLVDAKRIPDQDLEKEMDQFKSIARTVKYSLKDHTKYNSYQIVFVETHEGFGESHRAGTTVRSKDL